ncbi:tryptophan--tRNA ligase [Candidatus Micrarchaeota archaeon]|nr:tryptophan--tRNA ligase [Candidatus Micrarchaeota archaeon]MBU1930440.1 tryptophan--tRNA ligase [Candidatus Micrarchaeota archaeon]
MVQTIDPWGNQEVKVDNAFLKQFGLQKFSETNQKQFKNHFFERNLMICHRDFDKFYAALQQKKRAVQLTGIASSGPLHLGHKVDLDFFLFIRSLGAESHLGICDIDAYVSRPDKKLDSMKKAKEIAVNNTAHALALGINKKEIYVQSQKPPRYYEFAFELSKKMTENTFRAIYGHLDLGKLSANFLQYADILHYQLKEFGGECPTLTGIGIEQDPHARASRDLVRRISYKMFLPSFAYFQHQGGLKEGTKMSASEPHTAIFLDDSLESAKQKIQRAFSGGRESLEKHRKLGGIPEIDKSYEILRFHHPDSKLVEHVYTEYKTGKMLTSELKKITIDFLTDFLSKHQAKVKKNLDTAEKIVYKK